MFTVPLLGLNDGKRYHSWILNDGEKISKDVSEGELNVISTHIYVGC